MFDFARRLGMRPGTKPLRRTIADKDLVSYRGSDGRLLIAHNACPHRAAALHRGPVKGDCIVCPYHGMPVGPTGHAAQFVQSTESAGAVWIDAASLGFDAIPREPSVSSAPPISPEFVNPSYRVIEYSKTVRANPVLMTENTLDWKHLASVHRFSLVEGDPLVTQHRAGANGMATYEYTGPAFDLTIENEYWVPFTTCLRFIFTDKASGKTLKPLLLWFSLTPMSGGMCALHLRIARGTVLWMPWLTDQLFKLIDELPLWEDLEVVADVDPSLWSANKLTPADALVAAYRMAMLNTCHSLLGKYVT